MLDGDWREAVDRGLIPIGHRLRRIGITADVVTVMGILMAAGAAVAIGAGELKIGFLLLILTGVPDALDGAVAKASGTTSLRGAYFDSVSDRLADVLLFSGVAWHLSATRDDQLVMLPVALMGAAILVSYQRAKAESLGFEAKGGLMERAERFIALAFGLLFSSLLIPTLWVMLALTLQTAGARFWKVWKQASEVRPTPAPRPERRMRRRATRPRSSALERAAARRRDRTR